MVSFVGDKPPIRIITVLVVLSGYVIVSRATMELNEQQGRVDSKVRQDADRDRIARDIHDLLGQSLTVVALKAQIIERLSPDPADKDRAAEITAISRQAISELRYTVAQLRCRSMAEEIEAARQALLAAGIQVVVQQQGEVRHWKFSWVSRTAVTNIIRYSGATQCVITISNDEISISDNGVEGTIVDRGAEFHEVAEHITRTGGTFELNHDNGTTIKTRLH
ncbi:MAG: histidine kinase [Corynebacterium sp.]|nr:histidine kinase [Corynebacterium sp.]